MNETTQQEKTTQLSSRNAQLNSAVGTKQLNSALHCRRPPTTAYNRLQPPTTACNPAFTAESAFSTYSPPRVRQGPDNLNLTGSPRIEGTRRSSAPRARNEFKLALGVVGLGIYMDEGRHMELFDISTKSLSFMEYNKKIKHLTIELIRIMILSSMSRERDETLIMGDAPCPVGLCLKTSLVVAAVA
ncbi:hypothetical protein TNCV_626631 [Trichonephila clavipes]|nr:hypothetical protein TNCV_626631 [Trichonephila clavipes]